MILFYYMVTMIKNIVFDFGGVIVDLDREQAVDAFVRMGLKDANRILDKYHQTGIFRELEEGKLSEEAYRAKLGGLCGRQLTQAEVQQAWLGFICGMDVRKLEYLEHLRHAGYHTYLLSNTNPYIMGWARTPQFSPAGKGIGFYFDKLYLSFEMHCMKPHPAIFTQMLEDARIRPEETLFVDDSEVNARAGQAAGMHAFCPENASDWRMQIDKLLSVSD